MLIQNVPAILEVGGDWGVTLHALFLSAQLLYIMPWLVLKGHRQVACYLQHHLAANTLLDLYAWPA